MGPTFSVSCECISSNSINKDMSGSSLNPKTLFANGSSKHDSLCSNPQSDSQTTQSLNDSNSPTRKPSVNDFVVQKILGKGASGKVLLVSKKPTNSRFYAMKIIQKSHIYCNKLFSYVKLEKETLKNNTSPFIVKLHYCFQTPTKIYLVMDFMSGGDLFHLLRNKKRFSLNVARFYISEVVLALQYLHEEMKLVYRDLKPENILITNNGHIKITDFGLSKSAEEKCLSFVGTPEYAAPEIILNQEQSNAVDVWSLGVLLYEMIAGRAPFDVDAGSKNHAEIQSRIIKEEVGFPSFFTDETKDLISQMLRKDPKERILLRDIKKHRFFEAVDWEKVENLELQTPFKCGQERISTKEQKELKESYDMNSFPDLEGLSYSIEGLDVRD